MFILVQALPIALAGNQQMALMRALL